MRIIAYTYDADFQCVDCTVDKTVRGVFKIDLNHPYASPGNDEHGVPYAAVDSEGNLIHPVFSTDELPCHLPESAGGYSPVVCGCCEKVIAE